MVSGRRQQYNNRMPVTTNVEGEVYKQFRLICDRRHENLAQLLDKWMRDYIKDHEQEQYPKKLYDYSENAVQELPPLRPEPEKCIFTVDLNQKINHGEITNFIHKLNKEQAARMQGLGKTCYTQGKIVVGKHRGIQPKVFRNDDPKEYHVPTFND